MKPQIPWFRVLVEGVVIVGSILLAFGIEAAWEGRQERDDERASLQLLIRDLSDTVDQLAEFEVISGRTFDAAISAYTALSGAPGGIDQGAVSDAVGAAGDRRTVRIPSAAYTDLVSTGSLRLVRDRALRDQIIRFYEDARRSEDIISANNAVYLDGLVTSEIYGTGLVHRRPGAPTGIATIDAGTSPLGGALEEDFVHPPDRLWTLPDSAPEWDRVRGTMLEVASAVSFSRINAGNIIAGATALRGAIEAELQQRR